MVKSFYCLALAEKLISNFRECDFVWVNDSAVNRTVGCVEPVRFAVGIIIFFALPGIFSSDKSIGFSLRLGANHRILSGQTHRTKAVSPT